MTTNHRFHLSTTRSLETEPRSAHGQPSQPTHQHAGHGEHLPVTSSVQAYGYTMGGNCRQHLLPDIPPTAERIRQADARLRSQVPRSHRLSQVILEIALASDRNQLLPSELEPQYQSYQMSTDMQSQISSENLVGPRDGYGQPDCLAVDERLVHTGSWCHSTPTDSNQEEWELPGSDRDVLSDDWRPKTPRDTRLSTPDLPPLSTDFEFCPCHHSNGDEQDRINEDFYFVSRSKMDMQSELMPTRLRAILLIERMLMIAAINALAHIAQSRSAR
ncbi:hypothetical protein ACHAPU_007818 [Fusarium lateritium]